LVFALTCSLFFVELLRRTVGIATSVMKFMDWSAPNCRDPDL
jgi:hypothetical protein